MKKVPNIHVFGAEEEVFSKEAEEPLGIESLLHSSVVLSPSPIPLTSHTSLYFSVLEKAFVQLSTKVFTLDLNHDTQLDMRGFPR